MRLQRVGSLSTAALMFVAASSPLVGQDPSRDVPEVSTTATVIRSVKPDLATVTFSFDATGASPALAGRRLAARADSLRRALETLGIPRDSLVSGSRWYWWRGRIDVQTKQQCIPKKERTPYGSQCDVVVDSSYVAHDAIEVRMRDLTRVGAAIDLAMGFGITQISDVQFQATDVAAVLDDMLREGARLARRRAEAMAEASGEQLGRLMVITTDPPRSASYSSFFEQSGITTTATDGVDRGTTVVGRAVKLSISVYGRWELAKKP